MQSVNECFDNVKEDYLKFLNKEKIFGKSKAEKITSLKKIYIPISFWIENKYKKKGETLILGFSGGQGSGKTTVTGILKIILKNFFRIIFKIFAIVVFPEPWPPENPKIKVFPFFLYLFSIQNDMGI